MLIILTIIIACYAVPKFTGKTDKRKNDEKHNSNNDKKHNSNIEIQNNEDLDIMDYVEIELDKLQQKAEEELLSKGGKLIYICPSTGKLAYLNAKQVRKLQSQGQEWIKAKSQCLAPEVKITGLLTDEERDKIKQLLEKEEEIEKRIGRNVDQDVREQYINEQMGGEEVYNWLKDRRACWAVQEDAIKEAAYYYVEKVKDYASRRIPTVGEQIEYVNKNTTPEQRQFHHEKVKALAEKRQRQEEFRRQRAAEETRSMIAGMKADLERSRKEEEEKRRYEKQREEHMRKVNEERHREKVEHALEDIEWELRKR